MTRVSKVSVVLCLSLAAAASAQTPADRSRSVLETAAAQGNVPAQYALGARAESAGNYGVAREWYRRAAEQGYAGAQFRLAHLLETDGLAADLDEARAWYQKAAAQGFEPATDRIKALDARNPVTAERVANRWRPTAAAVTGGVVVLGGGVAYFVRRRRRVSVREQVV